MKPSIDYTNVPVALCEYAIQYRRVNQLRLYLYLKCSSNGYLKYNGEVIVNASNDLKTCTKTIRNHLKWLLNQGWAELNENGNGIRILSYKSLSKQLQLRSAIGSILYKDQLYEIKSWACASVMKYYEKRRFWWDRRNEPAGLTRWSPQLEYVSPYPHLPLNYYAKVTHKSKSTAHRHRTIAKQDGILRTKKRFAALDIDANHKEGLKAYGHYNPNCIKQVGSKLYYQLPDELKIDILLRKKKELHWICKENRDGKKMEP